jgi:hypothetical protein
MTYTFICLYTFTSIFLFYIEQKDNLDAKIEYINYHE